VLIESYAFVQSIQIILLPDFSPGCYFPQVIGFVFHFGRIVNFNFRTCLSDAYGLSFRDNPIHSSQTSTVTCLLGLDSYVRVFFRSNFPRLLFFFYLNDVPPPNVGAFGASPASTIPPSFQRVVLLSPACGPYGRARFRPHHVS